jgi:dihydroorotate dehydrogenase electron transfer subunit
LPKDINSIRIVTIKEIIEETPTVKTLVFRDSLGNLAKPGQFLMVWIPRCEELPLSVMLSQRKNHAAITIRKRGYGSSALFNIKEGEKIGIRGPYGNSFTVQEHFKKIILIGGGTGMVPLVRLLSSIRIEKMNITIIIGSKTKGEMFFVDLISKLLKNNSASYEILISTEDGSFGIKGFPVEVLEKILETKDKENVDMVYTCGPEIMMKKIYDICIKKGAPLQASIERYMKCGIGICSSCCINDTLVCLDGTIFNTEQLKNLPEFGSFYRDKSGKLEKYEIY